MGNALFNNNIPLSQGGADSASEILMENGKTVETAVTELNSSLSEVQKSLDVKSIVLTASGGQIIKLYRSGNVVSATCSSYIPPAQLNSLVIPAGYRPPRTISIQYSASNQADAYGKYIDIKTDGTISYNGTGSVLFASTWITTDAMPI